MTDADFIDEDYIDVEKSRADISVTEPDDDVELSRTPRDAERSLDSSHRFDTARGAGASTGQDDLIDENAVIEHDGRAETNTFFYPSQAPTRSRRQYRRLIRWQEGEGTTERDMNNRAADRKRWIESFGGYLDLTTYQIERTKYVIGGMNMSHMAHYSSQKVILAVISLVANEDGRFIRKEIAFKKLARDCGTDLSEIKNIRQLVQRKSDRL